MLKNKMNIIQFLIVTCICTDWQLINSIDETNVSKTTEVFLQESITIELILPLTCTVESAHLYMYTTLFISAFSTTKL